MPILPFKSRTFNPGFPIQVYRNLHDKDGSRRWSLRQNGLIVGHADEIYLRCVDFHVSPAGRNRVRREGRKNVHAYADGLLSFDWSGDPIGEITYDPYKDDGFVLAPYPDSPPEPITYYPHVRFRKIVEAVNRHF